VVTDHSRLLVDDGQFAKEFAFTQLSQLFRTSNDPRSARQDHVQPRSDLTLTDDPAASWKVDLTDHFGQARHRFFADACK